VILLFALTRRIRTSAGIAVLLPLSPIILLTALGFLAGYGGNLLSRQNGDISTGNNRLYIWRVVFDYLKSPHFSQFIGYGANGQSISHLSDYYAYLFNFTTDATLYTTHNIALQTILDTGYIGLVVLVAVVVAAIRCFERNLDGAPGGAPLAAGPLALLLVLVLAGLVDAAPSYLFLDTFVLFAITLASAAGSLPFPATELPPSHAADAMARINRPTNSPPPLPSRTG
jgi:O-antigen ligase